MVQFKNERESVKDLPRSGRPSTSRTDENKDRVEKAIMENRRVTIGGLCATLGLTHGTVHRIIDEDLKMSKVSARWVPRMLDDAKKEARVNCCEELLTRYQADPGFLKRVVTMDETWIPLFNPETKMQSKQWKHTESPPPKKFRVGESVEKILYSFFWDQEGCILAYPVPKGTTITGVTYRAILNDHLLPAITEKRPHLVGKFILHQDNAPPHKARIVTDFFAGKRH